MSIRNHLLAMRCNLTCNVAVVNILYRVQPFLYKKSHNQPDSPAHSEAPCCWAMNVNSGQAIMQVSLDPAGSAHVKT